MTLTPNIEQIKGSLRWFVNNFGAFIAGWFAAKGWFTVDQVTSVLNNQVLLGMAASMIAGAWTLLTHTQGNAVAVADSVPSVAGVVMKNTEDGAAIAKANPSPTVTVAGTVAAAQVASK